MAFRLLLHESCAVPDCAVHCLQGNKQDAAQSAEAAAKAADEGKAKTAAPVQAASGWGADFLKV